MNDYINEGADVFNEPEKKKGFTIGKLLKAIMLLIIVTVNVVLMVRCYMTNDDKVIEEVLVDQTFIDAYNADKENFQVLKYGMKNSWTAVREGRLLEYNHLYHVPLAHQLQVSVKFNTDLPRFEYKEEIPFKFKLVDENNNEYSDYRYKYVEKYGYGYIRLCFNGIDLEKKDEQGNVDNELNTQYALCVEMINKDGSYTEIAKELIYEGSKVNRPVEFTPELN